MVELAADAGSLRVLVFPAPNFFAEGWDAHFAPLFEARGGAREIAFFFKNLECFGDAAAALVRRHAPALQLVEQCAQTFHLAVCIGGDGCVLWLNQFLRQHPVIPVIAVKTGTLGFITQFRAEELPGVVAAVARWAEGAPAGELTPVPRIHCALTRPGAPPQHNVAVNEVALKSTNEYYRCFEVQVDGVCVASVKCDGLVISSQTGSTAYNASLHGPIVAVGADALVVSAIAPFACNFRPIVVGRGQTVRVEMGAETHRDALVFCDSTSRDRIGPGDAVAVSLGETAFKLVSQDFAAGWVAKVRQLFHF